jgi:hypothetical protein
VNHSLRSAHSATHLKVVCLPLIVSIMVVVAALEALTSVAWSMR